MDPIVVLVMAAAAITLALCLLLVFHPDYQTGPLGAVAMGMIGLSALGRVMQLMEHPDPLRISPIALFLWVGVALLMVSLTWKFCVRLRAKLTGRWYERDGRKEPTS